jgi:hypothetical protein
MILLGPIYLAIALACQNPAPGESSPTNAAAERLKFMKESVESYELRLGEERGSVLKLQDKPVFRLGKQYTGDLADGAIFLWTSADGRPQAAVQNFLIKHAREEQGTWVHEFTSLTPSSITAVRNGRTWWAPQTPGLELKPVPGAAKPAESAAQRARQMRLLAADFRASDDFGGRGWTELRLLPTPISRYGESGTNLLDGELFAFVLGTDPEVFLFLEARSGKQGLEWQYALAPMTIFAVKASYQAKAVWELPNRGPAVDPKKPFYVAVYVP